MVSTVSVEPQMLTWARIRSGRTAQELAKNFPRLIEWEAGVEEPTMTQLANYADATHVPIGYLFLPNPPAEQIPITDFRRRATTKALAPTPDLLDTIHACEQRQEWYSSFAKAHGYDRVPLVGSQDRNKPHAQAAAEIREQLGISLEQLHDLRSWADALRELSERAQDVGILVMINGVVGNNTKRKLDPNEFGGFALSDEHAPLVFVNGADTKAAQIFTLAHELGHIALGQSAVSLPEAGGLNMANAADEEWCNYLAAELLVPVTWIRREFDSSSDLTEELERLARIAKVSTLVVLKRLFDAELIDRSVFFPAYQDEAERVRSLPRPESSGGNFYTTLPVRVSKRFARAVLLDTFEGRTMYGDALKLLGLKKSSHLEELSHRLGVA